LYVSEPELEPPELEVEDAAAALEDDEDALYDADADAEIVAAGLEDADVAKVVVEYATGVEVSADELQADELQADVV